MCIVFLEPGFEWPDVIAAAMASVAFDLNPVRIEPRLYHIPNSDVISCLDRFENRTVDYFQQVLKKLTVDQLKDKIRRRAYYSGEALFLGGNKPELINRLRMDNRNFLENSFGNTKKAALDSAFIDKELMRPYEVESEQNLIIANFGNLTLTRKILRQLCPQRRVENNLMAILFQMLQTRDERIMEAHRDVNHTYKYYTELAGFICRNILNNQ